MPSTKSRDSFDAGLRQYIYRHLISEQQAPLVVQMAAALAVSSREVRAGLRRLAKTHAFALQANGELWRAAPFSAIPTAFPVQAGRRSWWANCIWDALGIPAMLHKDATLPASCGCCNSEMTLMVKSGTLSGPRGIIHIAVPARHWYDDIVFT
jgi:hypothetical protein